MASGLSLDDRVALMAASIEDIFTATKFRRDIASKWAERVLSKVQDEPDEEKFRRIDTAKLARAIGKECAGDTVTYSLLHGFLVSVGFRADGTHLILDKDELLDESAMTGLALIRERRETIAEAERSAMERVRIRNESLRAKADKSIMAKRKAKDEMRHLIDVDKEDMSHEYRPSGVSSTAKDVKFGRTDKKVEFKTSGGG
jgi:hypothetical protein